MNTPSTYKSYLLRLWKVAYDGKPVWRASLQSTATGQHENFPNLESLFAYLSVSGEERSSNEKAKSTIPAQD